MLITEFKVTIDSAIERIKAIKGGEEKYTMLRHLQKVSKLFGNALESNRGGVAISTIGDDKDDTAIDPQDNTEYNNSERFSIDKNSSKKKRSFYNQFIALAKQWANSTKTKRGDVKALYNAQDNTWNKIIADNSDDRYEILKSIKDTPQNNDEINKLLDEVNYDNNQPKQRNGESLFESIKEYENTTRNGWDDSLDAENTNANGQIGRIHQAKSESDRITNSKQSRTDSRIEQSHTDSVGNTLTEAQQEYFKDSKVRDKDGNLLVVYHGTNNDFFTFDNKTLG